MTSSICRHRATATSTYVLLVVAFVASGLPSGTMTTEATPSVGHRQQTAFPLRSAMEIYASSKDVGGDDENEGDLSPSASDLAAFDDGDVEAIADADERFRAAAVERRGFRNGGRDRFSHGFGRKRSEDDVELSALKQPDHKNRLARDLAFGSHSIPSHPGRRTARATLRRRDVRGD